MLYLVLVDTAIERIPKSLAQTSSVRKAMKKFGSAAKLLDTTWHHTDMKSLPNSHKRGRPDILHHFLLDTLGSPANLSGNLQILFHCSDGLFQVASNMRCPRDYLRFKSLMVPLLEQGHVPPKKPYLIRRITQNFSQWVKVQFSADRIFKFTSSGTAQTLEVLMESISSHSDDTLIMIGGFQKGGFSPLIQDLPGQTIALPNQGYDSWIVVNRVCGAYEKALHLIE